jgi:N-methylhydantoinase B
VAYRFLADGEIGIHDERWLTHPWGVLGGETGRRSTKRLVRGDGSEQWLPAKIEGVKVKAGDLLYFNTWGGGGWGDPYARDPELVRQDIERRLVTVEGARRYGVVIADDGTVDTGATETLREELRAARGEPTLFNRGGTIEELKARCQEETHLAPPESPQFTGSSAA